MVGSSAKDYHIRLIPNAALDGRDLKWIKVHDTKGCHLMCWGNGYCSGGDERFSHHFDSTSRNSFACAIQKAVYIYQIDRSG